MDHDRENRQMKQTRFQPTWRTSNNSEQRKLRTVRQLDAKHVHKRTQPPFFFLLSGIEEGKWARKRIKCIWASECLGFGWLISQMSVRMVRVWLVNLDVGCILDLCFEYHGCFIMGSLDIW